MNLKFGIPGSRIKDKIADVDINCTSEEQAFAVACGCILAGKEPTVYMQNSGFGRCIDILTSLYKPYEISFPKLILSIRKQPYHHSFIGNITYNLLELLQYDNVDIVEQEAEHVV